MGQYWTLERCKLERRFLRRDRQSSPSLRGTEEVYQLLNFNSSYNLGSILLHHL